MCSESAERLSPLYLSSETSVLFAITEIADEPGAKQEDPQLQIPPLLRPSCIAAGRGNRFSCGELLPPSGELRYCTHCNTRALFL